MNEEYFDNYFTSYLLASIGGFLDIYTYLLKGKVFANAQTGNLVLLAHSLIESNLNSAITYLFPIIAFGTGIFLSNIFKYQLIPVLKMNFHLFIILIELAIFVFLITVPLGNLIFNSIIGFVCALQVSSFASTRNIPYASTMCTGNLRLMANNLYYGLTQKNTIYLNNALFYFKIITSFVIGAMIATKMITHLGTNALLYCIFILITIVAVNYHRLKRLG